LAKARDATGQQKVASAECANLLFFTKGHALLMVQPVLASADPPNQLKIRRL
jgi:hypothetical protein